MQNMISKPQSSPSSVLLALTLLLALTSCQSQLPVAAPQAPLAHVQHLVQVPIALPAPAAPRASPEPRHELARRVLEARGKRIPAGARSEILDELERTHAEHGLDPLLVLALIEQESRFAPRARGPHGSLGLMQVRPFVGEDLAERGGMPWSGPETLFDPAANVRLGTAYLRQMIDLYGDVELALAAYNLGPYKLRRMLKQGRRPRGRYAGKIHAHRAGFIERFGIDSVAPGAPSH